MGISLVKYVTHKWKNPEHSSMPGVVVSPHRKELFSIFSCVQRGNLAKTLLHVYYTTSKTPFGFTLDKIKKAARATNTDGRIKASRFKDRTPIERIAMITSL